MSTRSSSGAHEMDAGGLDISSLLLEIETETALALAPSVTLDIKISDELPILSCSREGLRDAILQLLANARDALPSGGTIFLSATTVHERDAVKAVDLRVIDGGYGMPGDMLRRAAEPYFTTKTTGLGGLGLTIVSHFASEAGGNFHLQSEPGIGTQATLSLPISLR